ncbi:MAG: hypothetical protein KAI17_19225 [Thiotrichaceae bacterium]|nr:hypothetical protein [Thiotrichaceae bacterium]
MKNNSFKNSVISMLSVCILLLLSSQAVLAVKPATTTPTPAAVINSVVLDITSSTIVVTGAELGSITTVTLGGLDVSFTSSTDGNTGVINFTDIDAATAAVLMAGNYSLVLGDNIFSIYLSSTDAAAITPEVVVDPGVCPCTVTWEDSNIFTPQSCVVVPDGTQETIFSFDSTTWAAFDPNDLFFDPDNIGNSISYCAYVNPVDLSIVGSAITTQDQYDDCKAWMTTNVCPSVTPQ